jgi:hypothetical protein
MPTVHHKRIMVMIMCMMKIATMRTKMVKKVIKGKKSSRKP